MEWKLSHNPWNLDQLHHSQRSLDSSNSYLDDCRANPMLGDFEDFDAEKLSQDIDEINEPLIERFGVAGKVGGCIVDR